MKIRNNLYILNGVNSPNSYYQENNIFNIKNLQKYVNIIQINNDHTGFKLSNLSNLVKRKIDDNDERIDLVIDIHGGMLKKKYYFLSYIDPNDSSKDEIIKASEFVESLIIATGRLRLNILLTSCEGDNFASYIKDLPKGSKVMITTDADKSYVAFDALNPSMDLMHQIIFNNSFKLEYLFELYCFNQKTTTSNPTVYNITEKGVEALDFELIKNKYINSNQKYSLFTRVMFDHRIFNKSKWDQVYKKLYTTEIKSLIPPCGIASNIVNKTARQEFEEYKNYLEEQYYFSGDLTRLKFGLNEEFLKKINTLNEYRELRKKSDDPESKTVILNEINKLNEVIQHLTLSLIKEHIYSSPTEFYNIDATDHNNLNIYYGTYPQHSIVMGLLVDYAINNELL